MPQKLPCAAKQNTTTTKNQIRSHSEVLGVRMPTFTFRGSQNSPPNLFCLLILFFFFLAAPRPMEFLSQGSDLSLSCGLSRSCSNTRSLTQCAGPGIKPASQRSQDATGPGAPHWDLLLIDSFFLSFCHFLGCSPRHMEVPRLGVALEEL